MSLITVRMGMAVITPGHAGAMACSPDGSSSRPAKAAAGAIHGAAPVAFQLVEGTGVIVFAALQSPAAAGTANATAFLTPHGPAAIKAVQLPLTLRPEQGAALRMIELGRRRDVEGMGLGRWVERLQGGQRHRSARNHQQALPGQG